MKRMSFWLTRQQMYDRAKSVTRRSDSTWNDLKPGDVIMAIEKGQGLKKGEKQKEIGPIRILSITREPLIDILYHDVAETMREGFPDFTPNMFIDLYLKSSSGGCYQKVKRIEFEFVDDLPDQLELGL